MDWFDRLRSDDCVRQLTTFLEGGGPSSAHGAVGSSTTLLTAALARAVDRPFLLVLAHLDDADEATDELVGLDLDAQRFPALEVLPGESSVSLDLLTDRLRMARRLAEGRCPRVVVAPIAALMQGMPPPDRLADLTRILRAGERVELGGLLTWLEEAGYRRMDTIESPGEFAVRGGIVDLFPPGGATPVRLDLFGDEIERLFEIDLETMASDREIREIELVGASAEALQADEDAVPLTELLPGGTVAVLAETIELLEQGRGYFERVHAARSVSGPPSVFASIGRRCHAVLDVNHFSPGAAPERLVTLPVDALPPFADDVPDAVRELGELGAEAATTVLCDNDGEAQRTRDLLREHAPDATVSVERRHLHRGFVYGAPGPGRLALVPQHELLHRYGVRRRVRSIGSGTAREAFLQLQPGDYVVHRDHGIARFTGLGMLPRGGDGAEEEVLTLEFDGGTLLHVPAARIDVVQKYVGAGTQRPQLSTMGGKRWKRQKEQAEEAVRDLAAEMLRVQAAREASSGIRFPDDTAWQSEFEAEFPYEETEDQVSAINASKRDMCSGRPMDRLVCGDVGFGKTEVAMRAAFKAVEYGKQVGVLVPTTVLAEQHEQTFRERFAAYPFRIESLSRFKTAAEQKALLQELAHGRVDIIIGTHRLLSADVRFADLGLVVVDEEQRFGVEHKQRLLQFRMTADVMTLSATPIPRTLHMAMLGLRDISSLTTPPLDRRAIVTEVIPHNPRRIKQALERELAREGQVFYVHNRVHDIESVADDVQQLVPDARIIIGHGQMPPKELEKVMLRFMRRQADILVSTTIIESGIDIPTANTMIIRSAQMFGLAELHQLRGRVGRYKHRAYCYLLLPEDRTVSEDAMKRLRAIEDYSMLGAGFKIAMRDLEIRGAGNLLGAEQSGHIAAVGYEMYCQLLEEAVAELRHDARPRHADTVLQIGVRGAIPRGYIPSDARRMEAYRRIAGADGLASLEQIGRDLQSAYGEPPRSTQAMLDLAEVRIAAAELGIRSIILRDADVIFRTARPADLEQAMRGAQGSLRVVGGVDGQGLAEVYFRPPRAFLEAATLVAVLRRRLVPAVADAPSAGGGRIPMPNTGSGAP